MSTYLKICQDVARECGIAGGADASPKPLAVTGQVGELNRLVNWVQTAYTELQNAKKWRFLRKKFTLNTVAGTDTYAFGDCTDVETTAAITRFDSWRLNDRRNPPKIHLQSTGVGGQVFLSWTIWDNFEYLYKTSSLQNQTAFPFHITFDPDDDIVLGITPNDIYVVTGSYYRSPQILVADADIPEMPKQFHNLIMYQAMEYYGLFESAPEIISRAQKGMKKLGHQLNKNQSERFRVGGSLA
ncbi:MAG: hypothetical protein COA78_12155 [Blastopirellula sp.]|nr:MAG: hypothetical protein COA78_12155 [Blastopirellula sp.]